MNKTFKPTPDEEDRLSSIWEQFEDAWKSWKPGTAYPDPTHYLNRIPAGPFRELLQAKLIETEQEFLPCWRLETGKADSQRYSKMDLRELVTERQLQPDTRLCKEGETISVFACKLIEGAFLMDKYVLRDVLGKGGMGQVYLAENLYFDNSAQSENREPLFRAIKVINHDLIDIRDFERFRIEAEAISRLRHDNIVKIIDLQEWNGRPYLCLEYVDGKTLSASDRYKLPVANSTSSGAVTTNPEGSTIDIQKRKREIAELMVKLADAVQHVHLAFIVHRDLKPTNVLLDKRFNPKISDFGLAKFVDRASGLTGSQDDIGTPQYMAPEQVGEKHSSDDTQVTNANRDGSTENSLLTKKHSPRPEIKAATDIYGLGGILYFLLTGRPPFSGPAIDVLPKVKDPNIEVNAAHHINANVDQELSLICSKCLRKSPDDRYESARALQEDLKRYLNNEPVSACDYSRVEKIRKWCRRNPVVTIGVLSLVALVTVGLTAGMLGWWYWMEASEKLTLELNLNETKQLVKETEKDLSKIRRLNVVAESDLRKTQELQNRTQSNTYLASAHNQAGIRPKLALAELDKCKPGFREYTWGMTHRMCRPTVSWTTKSNEHAQVRFASDGDLVAVLGKDGKLYLWDELSKTSRELLAPGPVTSFAFSPDGKRIAIGNQLGRITLRQVNAVATGKTVAGPVAQPVMSVAFSPDGEQLAYAQSDSATVTILDTDTLKPVKQLPCADIGISALVFAEGGSTLLGLEGYGKLGAFQTTNVVQWDCQTGVSQVVCRPGRGAFAMAVSPNERMVAILADNMVSVFNRETKEYIRKTPISGAGPMSVAFSPDNGRLAVGTFNPGNAQQTGVVRVFSLNTGDEILSYPAHHKMVRGLSFSPTGDQLATVGADADVLIRNISGKPARRVFTGHTSDVHAVVFAENGSCFSAGRDRVIRHWDFLTGREYQSMAGHTELVTALAIHPDGNWLASGGNDRTIRIWDIPTHTSVKVLTRRKGSVTGLAFTADKKSLIAAFDDGAVEMRHTDSWNWDRTLRSNGQGGWVRDLAISKTLVVGAIQQFKPKTGKLWVYDRTTHRSVTNRIRLKHSLKEILKVALGNRGNLFACAGTDKDGQSKLFVWNLAAGSEPTWHDDLGAQGVTAMTFTQDDATLVVASSQDIEHEGRLHFYDTFTHDQRLDFLAHTKSIYAVKFAGATNPFGPLATASHDQTVNLWLADPWKLK